MRKIYLLFLVCTVLSCSKDIVEITEQENEKTPEENEIIYRPLSVSKLHVQDRFLKDQCGNNVLLHGVAMTPSPWFNGGHVGDGIITMLKDVLTIIKELWIS